jgi:hypothetical protein
MTGCSFPRLHTGQSRQSLVFVVESVELVETLEVPMGMEKSVDQVEVVAE